MSENLPAIVGRCVRCGCTDATPCLTDVGACHWASDEVCSGCVTREDPRKLREAAIVFMMPASAYEARILRDALEQATFKDAGMAAKANEIREAFDGLLEKADGMLDGERPPAGPELALPGRDF